MPTINYETGVRTGSEEPEPVEEEIFSCSHCGEEHRFESDAYECCRYYCEDCGTEYRYSDEADDCCAGHYCPDCGAHYSDEEDAMSCCSSRTFHGSMPYLPEVDPYRVSVPAIQGRPARLCSIEQELAAGGGIVARLLYDIGIAPDADVREYHSRATGPGTAKVEEDGSLPSAGGEVVYDRFNLALEHNIESLSRALTKIRQLRDAQSSPRLVQTSYAAGIHVHLAWRDEDGHTMGPGESAALYELWSYAEDMLYSFSAAGWQRHRQPTDTGPYSGGYCKAVPKVEGAATPAKVWRAMRADRYFGLNFQRLYNSVSRCSCGAATMGDWDACDCGAFDGATVEFRVFNSSTLPRTIHAWLLMAHAMVAHASRHELGTLPVNPYGSQTPAEKREVLEHLLEVLPLLDEEREVIREAAGRSPGL